MAREPGRIALAALALGAVTLGVFWQFPVRGRAYLPADLLPETAPWRDASVVPTNPASQDPIRQYFPSSARFASLLATKGAFRWESALGCGEPLSIQPPFQADYPPARVAYRLLPAWAASATLAALHLFAAGAGMIFWARARGARTSSALAAGIGYALAPWNMAWLEADTIVVAWAALPWGLGFLERARAARDPRLAAGAALAFGLGALGGHLHVLELGLLAAGALALATSQAGEWRLSLVTTGVGLLGALLVAAARLVPAAVELAASGRGRIPLERWFDSTGSLDLRRSLLLVFPDLLGNPVADPSAGLVSTSWIERGAQEAQANFLEMRPHVGTVVLALALVGAVGRPRSRALLALAAGAFALALRTPLAFVPWAFVPGWGATTPLRALVLVPLFLGPLVASGLDVLADESALVRRRALAPVLALSAVVLALFLVLASPAGPGLVAPGHAAHEAARRALEAWLSPTGRALGRPLLLAVATLAGVAAALGPHRARRRLARALVTGLLALDLLEAGARLQTTCEPAALYPGTPATEVVAGFTGPNGRALLEHDVPLDALLSTGVPTVGAYESAHLERTLDLFEAIDPPRARQWLRVSPRLSPDWQRFLAVSVILAPAGAVAPSPDVALVYSGEATVFARPGAARGWLYPESAATVVASEADALALCSKPGFSPLEGVVIEFSYAGLFATPAHPARPRPVAVSEPDPEHVRVSLEATVPSVFVLSDSFAPGVRAEIDGQEATVLPAFVAFRAVLVPFGKHESLSSFTPPGWPWAPVVSWAAGLACLAVVLGRRRRRT